MALTRESVATARETVSQIQSEKSNFASNIGDGLSQLRGNDNYQTFVEGTELGKDLDTKLLLLIDIINGMMDNEVTNIIGITNAFIDVQEQLNAGNN